MGGATGAGERRGYGAADARQRRGRSCGHRRGARTELWTPAREIQRQAAGGCEREKRELAMRLQLPLVTHSLLFFLP